MRTVFGGLLLAASCTFAASQGLACFDIQQVFKPFGRAGIKPYFADMAHPNAEGDALIAERFARFLFEQAGLKPPETRD